MKKISKKVRYLIILSSLLFLALMNGLIIPSFGASAQGEASPTPTILTPSNGAVTRSGDTEGLILGAGIILFIILGGVILQRTVLKNTDQKPRE
jgi:hypothetical protein